jgi:hypothetical protein
VGEQRYSREDLLRAWLELKRSPEAVEELRTYREARVQALQAAFNVDLEARPDEDDQLQPLFENTVRCFNSLYSPFFVFLAGRPPPDYQEVERRHRGRLREAENRLRAAYRELLLELMERVWELGPDRTVSEDELRSHDFDPDREEPDPDLYW